MKRNVGPLDSKARITVGIGCGLLALLSLGGYVTVPLISEVGLGLIATVLIVEGAARRCLLYRMLGVDRCPVDN